MTGTLENDVQHKITWYVVSHIVCQDPHLCVCVFLYTLHLYSLFVSRSSLNTIFQHHASTP